MNEKPAWAGQFNRLVTFLARAQLMCNEFARVLSGHATVKPAISLCQMISQTWDLVQSVCCIGLVRDRVLHPAPGKQPSDNGIAQLTLFAITTLGCVFHGFGKRLGVFGSVYSALEDVVPRDIRIQMMLFRLLFEFDL